MLENPGTIIGLGDGGAHVGILSDASAITYMLTHWTRDRTRGRKFSLPWAIKRLTSDNANVLGLNDRGLLRVGKKADINIINYSRSILNLAIRKGGSSIRDFKNIIGKNGSFQDSFKVYNSCLLYTSDAADE